MDSKKIITLAEAGDPQAQFDLAIMYGRGVGVQINHNLAWDWIEPAANNAHAEAQYWLAYGYFYGNNTALDRAKAFSWYKKSAESGYANAQFMVAYLLDTGKFTEIPREPVEAVKWYSTAGNSGHAEAAFRLGCKSYFGVDVAKNEAIAQRWFEIAEKNGDPVASRFLKSKNIRFIKEKCT
jgi:TPR repeat protein